MIIFYEKDIMKSKWYEEENKFLRDNYLKMSPKEIGVALNRTECSVQNQLRRFKLNRGLRREWLIEEEEYLKLNYSKIKTSELSVILNRKAEAIVNRANQLGLTKFIHPDENEIIKDYTINLKNVKDMMKQYNCGDDYIYGILKKHNIKTRPQDNSVFGSRHRAWKGCGEISGVNFCKIQYGAKKRNLECNISIEYIWDLFLKQNRKCALSGVDLICNPSNKASMVKSNISLDRIDSSKGYIEGNVQWVHKIVNQTKLDIDENYFIKLCGLISGNIDCDDEDFSFIIDDDRVQNKLWASKNRAKKKGFDFNIDLEYLIELLQKQKYRCSLSKTKLDKNIISLDRIDSSKGYTKDNVQWVDKKINCMKNDLTQQDFINWCRLIYNNRKNI